MFETCSEMLILATKSKMWARIAKATEGNGQGSSWHCQVTVGKKQGITRQFKAGQKSGDFVWRKKELEGSRA